MLSELHLVADYYYNHKNVSFTPGRISQLFEVRGDRNQIRLDLQVHLSVLVCLHDLAHTQFQHLSISCLLCVSQC